MAEVLQPVRPEIPQRHLAGKRVPCQSRRRLREQDLTAVRDAGHTGSAVHVKPQTARRRVRRLATVQAHADTDTLARWPVVLTQRLLHLNHGRAITGRRENSEESIPRDLISLPP